ncbi:MAG: phosphatidate cytidylyltransferase [Treponema sp.]|jgi:phosphatidate cytidylyltransferase|nr:phosphatidate cytidylyltransferase [Treponema sp.]
MNTIAARLVVFCVGVPAMAALILLLPQYNHLALNILITAASSVGAVEFALMLRHKGFPVYPVEAAILGSLSPLAMTFIVSAGFDSALMQSLFIIGASWLLVSEVLAPRGAGPGRRRADADISRAADFSPVLGRLAAGFSVMIYPGLLLSWVITMSTLKHSGMVITAFLLTVMANDSIAWVTGMLFGKNNQGVFKVSPHKSLAGYIGGMAASVLVSTALAFLIPGVFVPDQIPRLPSAALLGFFSGVAVILGDLAESAIKRSCGFKDSGFLIPGRGGVLDSTDSIALTAPLFYVLYRFFF